MTCRRPSSNNLPYQGVFAAAIAACLITLFLGGSVSAAEGKPTHPKLARAIKWQVAPIQGKASDTRRFCSAKAGFSNGVTIVVGRDSTGGQSLALEFQNEEPFAAGATLPVVLNAGGQQQQVDGLAATRRVVLLSLPRGGIIESQFVVDTVLDVVVSDRRKIFAVGGFKPASDALDECVAAVVAGESFEVAKFDAEVSKDTFKTSPVIKERTVQRFSNVTPEEVREFIPAEAARAAVLQDEVERLRRQNQELMMHRQAIESQLLTMQGGATATPVPPAPVIQRSVKQIGWPSSESFDDMVATYLTTEAARCPADFAQTKGRAYGGGPQSVQEIEIACLGTPDPLGGSGRDYAAALLFVGTQGQVQVLMYQGPAGMIEQALAERANALASLKSNP